MIHRSDAAVNHRGGGRLAEIVAYRPEHDRNLLRPGQIADAAARLVDHLQGVHPHIALWMPLRLLGAPRQRLQFRKQLGDHAELHRQREADRRTRREDQLFDFAPHPLGRQIVERSGAAQLPRLVVQPQIEPGGKLHRPQHPQAVVEKALAIDDAKEAPADIATAVEGIQVLPGERIPGDGIDGEIAAPRRLLNRHRRIAGDLEPAMAAAGFRFAAGQRDVDIAPLVDLKALAHHVDAPERFEQLAQPLGVDAVHLEVEVFRSASHHPVAHPAADDQCAPAGGADGGRQRARAIKRIVGHDHSTIDHRLRRTRLSGDRDRER